MHFQFVTGANTLAEAKQRPVAVLWLVLFEERQESKPDGRSAAHLMLNCVKIAQDHGGLVHLRDDGITAVFGLPTAVEDDATRAVLAARDILQMIEKSSSANGALSVSYSHVVIHHHSGDVNDISIEGEALKQAEQHAKLIPPQKIWVTGAARSATNYYFRYKSATSPSETAVSLWEFRGIRTPTGQPRGLSGKRARFIGRSVFLQSMQTLSYNLNQGVGGIIWIEGEAGIGKSRLMREFIMAISDQFNTDMFPIQPDIWSGGCSPKHANHAFSLFTSLISNAFNLQSTDGPVEIRQKIVSRFQEWPPEVQNIQGYIEILAGLQPSSEIGEQLNKLQPEQLRQQTFVATRRLLKTLVKERPIILLCDDLHWIDPVSAELLLFIATMVVSDPILFVCAQRLQGADAPNDRLVKLQSLLPGHTNRLLLEKLSPQDSRQLVDELLSKAELPDQFYNLAFTRSAGNPYFIEEFVRLFIEQGHLRQEADQWQMNVPISQLQELIPVSINTLIHARIDALPEELRITLQQAAVIGFQFDAQLLREISEFPDIPQILERLAMRLMISSTAVSDLWEFNHILFHTILYDAIIDHHRQALHLRVSIAIQEEWGEQKSERAKELAFHLGQAKQYARAIPYLILAGEKAASQYANEEAVQHFQKANSYLSYMSEENIETQWRIAIGLGDAYRNMGQYAESTKALNALLPIAQNNPDFHDQYPGLLRRLGETNRKQGDFEAAQQKLTTAKKILGTPANQHQARETAQILTELAWVHFSQGQYDLARKICEVSLVHARKAESLYEEAKAENLYGGICYRSGDWQGALHHTTRATIYREHLGSTWEVAKTYENLGILAFAIGHWSKAVDYFQRNLSLRKELGDVEGLAHTHNNLGEAYLGQGKLSLAETHYRESLKLAEIFNILFDIANSSLGLARALTRQKKYDAAEATIDGGLIKARELDSQMMLAEMYRALAELRLAQGQWADALTNAQKASGLAYESGNRVLEAASWRVSSEAALHMDDVNTAQSLLGKAKVALDNATDELEKGQLAALSARINLAIGNQAVAKAEFEQAHKIFSRLGASHHLQKLEQYSSAQ